MPAPFAALITGVPWCRPRSRPAQKRRDRDSASSSGRRFPRPRGLVVLMNGTMPLSIKFAAISSVHRPVHRPLEQNGADHLADAELGDLMIRASGEWSNIPRRQTIRRPVAVAHERLGGGSTALVKAMKPRPWLFVRISLVVVLVRERRHRRVRPHPFQNVPPAVETKVKSPATQYGFIAATVSPPPATEPAAVLRQRRSGLGQRHLRRAERTSGRRPADRSNTRAQVLSTSASASIVAGPMSRSFATATSARCRCVRTAGSP